MLGRACSADCRDWLALDAQNWRPTFVWVVVVALLATTLLGGCGEALSNDPKNLFAQAEPATVIVLAEVSAHISTPSDWIFNEPKIRDALSAQGITESSPEWSSAHFDLVFNNPIEYLDPDYSVAPAETDTSSSWSGSGFIADPDGYVVTNAHVAAPPDDEVKAGLVEQGLQKFIERDVALWAKKGYSEDRLKRLAAADEQWMAHYLKVTNQVKTISVVMGANVQGTDVAPKTITADVVTAGEQIPGKDVAIIKIEGKNYPTAPLGDDSQLNVGDKLYVIGYPGVASGGVNQLISPKSITEPTFTTGVVSAKKQATQGYQVLQTDAAVTHGNSGGPVLNSQGQVVGIATFGAVDPSTGQTVQGYNFIMPSTLVKQFLDRSGAHPAQGEFTKLYAQGLAQEASNQYRAASATFQQIAKLSPGNPYVQQHVSQDEAAVAAGKDRTFGIAPMIALAAVFMLVVAIGMVIVFRGRGRKAAQPIPVQAAVIAPQEHQQLAEAPGAPVVGEGTVAAAPGKETVTLWVTTPSGTHQVVVGLPAIIGQGADSEVVLDDPDVGVHHAQIARVDGVLEVIDLGSQTGIQVNGSPVPSAALQHGDRIKLGHSEISLG
jgi:serine protease Do